MMVITVAALMILTLFEPSVSIAFDRDILIDHKGLFKERTPVNLRAWHTNGQTFLVWEHSPIGPPITPTYEIYTSSTPITSLDSATLIGEVFSNNGENRRLWSYIPNARWKLPNGFGGSYTVGSDEAYFVVTPHKQGVKYYAVVPYKGSIVKSENTVGPVLETTLPVTSYIQYEDENLTVYGHWIDGRQNYDSGRQDYPVMGNEHSNGIGFNFAVWKPVVKKSSDRLPMVIWLHGIAGSFIDDYIIKRAPSMVPDGIFVTLDDNITCGFLVQNERGTFWVGYADEFDRFSPSEYPSDSAVVVNYTARRIWWETEWLIKNEPVDSLRVSLSGISLGANAVLLHTQLRPDIYSAGLANVPPLNLGPWGLWFPLFGTGNQNLPTNFEGQPRIWNLLNATWRTQQPHSDWPYALLIGGRNDESVPWQSTRNCFVDLDRTKTGYALYWDEREHMNWRDAYFYPSEHLSPSYLTRFYKNKSFPAFSATDESQVPGRQPDIGNGNSLDGDPWGTWGGYFEWDTEDIVDEPDRWECTIWITSESQYECDIPLTDNILADVTLRRLQNFDPDPDRLYYWRVVDISNGITMQDGVVQPDAHGTLTIEQILLSKKTYRLIITDIEADPNTSSKSVYAVLATGVTERQGSLPQIFSLSQVRPNPFSSEVSIRYTLPKATNVSLKVYNVLGQEVKVLENSQKQTGYYAITWDGKGAKGRRVSKGIYFIRMEAGEFKSTKKMLFLR